MTIKDMDLKELRVTLKELRRVQGIQSRKKKGLNSDLFAIGMEIQYVRSRIKELKGGSHRQLAWDIARKLEWIPSEGISGYGDLDDHQRYGLDRLLRTPKPVLRVLGNQLGLVEAEE